MTDSAISPAATHSLAAQRLHRDANVDQTVSSPPGPLAARRFTGTPARPDSVTATRLVRYLYGTQVFFVTQLWPEQDG